MCKGKRKRYAAEFKAKVAPSEHRSVGSAFERRYALAAGGANPLPVPESGVTSEQCHSGRFDTEETGGGDRRGEDKGPDRDTPGSGDHHGLLAGDKQRFCL